MVQLMPGFPTAGQPSPGESTGGQPSSIGGADAPDFAEAVAGALAAAAAQAHAQQLGEPLPMGLGIAAAVQALLDGRSDGDGVGKLLQEMSHRPDRSAEAGTNISEDLAALAFLSPSIGTTIAQVSAVPIDAQVTGTESSQSAGTPKVAALPAIAGPTISVEGAPPVAMEMPTARVAPMAAAPVSPNVNAAVANAALEGGMVDDAYAPTMPAASAAPRADGSASRAIDVTGLAARDAATVVLAPSASNGSNANLAGDTPGGRPGASVAVPAADAVKPSHDAAATSNVSVAVDTPSQPVRTVDAGGIKTLDTVDGPEFVGRLADTIQSAALRGPRELRITLNPPELGRIEVRITDTAGGVRVDIDAGTAGARDLLQQHLPALQAALEGRDLRIDRLEVRQSESVLDQSETQLPDDQQQPRGDEQQAAKQDSPWSGDGAPPTSDLGGPAGSSVEPTGPASVESATPVASIDIRA